MHFAGGQWRVHLGIIYPCKYRCSHVGVSTPFFLYRRYKFSDTVPKNLYVLYFFTAYTFCFAKVCLSNKRSDDLCVQLLHIRVLLYKSDMIWGTPINIWWISSLVIRSSEFPALSLSTSPDCTSGCSNMFLLR